jgi:cytochrome P450
MSNGSQPDFLLDYGPFAQLAKLGKKYGKIFKTYCFGYPIVSISGADNIKSLLKNEFQCENFIGTFMMGVTNLGQIFGENMLLYENDAEKHAMIRRLVGSAMSPSAIGAAIPSIQERAQVQIDEMLTLNKAVKMEDVFQSYTLDIAWKQILGLDLNEDNIPKFHTAVRDWTAGLMNPLLLMPIKIPGVQKFTKVGRARQYLGEKIEEKIAKLERDGPGSSAFSNLFFATDEDGTRLTREQVIDNALLLIFAGTETSASTLTCTALLLALHLIYGRKLKLSKELCISSTVKC